MSDVVQFPTVKTPVPVTVEWRLRAYLKSDFSLLDAVYDDAAECNAAARRLYAMGYDITVRKHVIEHVADWVYDADWSEDQ
jgi:hypothetical protein